MLDNLTQRLARVMRTLRGEARLTEDNIAEEQRIEAAGGKVVQPKMNIGEFGFISIFIDTEGNTIGLHSRK